MKRLRHHSINLKLALILLGAMLLVLALTSAIFFASGVKESEARTLRQHDQLARLIATQAEAALTFDEPGTLQRDISSLVATPHLEAVLVYKANGELFASQLRATKDTVQQRLAYLQAAQQNLLPSRRDKHLSQLDDFDSYLYPVILRGNLLGHIQVIDNRQEIKQERTRSSLISLLIFAISSLLAVVLASYLSHVVTRPIHALHGKMKAFVDQPDYGIRAEKRANDEIGELVDSFNQMLEELQQRDLALERYHQGLEKLVAERTRELATAVQKAETANAAKTRFLANISHEVRTPLSTIQGLSQLLRNSAISDSQTAWLLQQEQASRHLIRIIDDLLDVALIDSGHARLENAPFRLHELLASVDAIVSSRAEEKQLSLNLKTHPGVPDYLSGDRRKLTQILLNLVNNAIKFTDHGGVNLSVRAGERGVEWVTLRFVVADSGKGIGALFKPFSQLQTDAAAPNTGLGLGLAISQELASAMGARIEVESKPGSGSRFSFSVRLRLSQAPADKLPLPASPNIPNPAQLLLVEDTALVAQVESALIQTLGIEVTVAANAAEAQQLLAQRAFDLVLMDIRLPDMDGCSLTRWIRDDSTVTDIPVVALTAHALASEQARCRIAGMNDVLTKPLVLEDLQRVLQQYLRSPQQRSALQPAAPRPSQDPQIWQRLEDLRRQLGNEGIANIVREILLFLPLSHENLQNAVKSRDIPGLRSTIHDLLGATGVWGDCTLTYLLRQYLSQPAQFTDLEEFARSVEREIHAVMTLATDYFESLQAPTVARRPG